MKEQKIINLIESLGWNNLPEEDRDALIEQTGNIVFQKVLARIMEKLTDTEKEEFDKLLSDENLKEEDLLSFIRSKVPNVDDLVRAEVGGFLKEADDIMSQI